MVATEFLAFQTQTLLRAERRVSQVEPADVQAESADILT